MAICAVPGRSPASGRSADRPVQFEIIETGWAVIDYPAVVKTSELARGHTVTYLNVVSSAKVVEAYAAHGR